MERQISHSCGHKATHDLYAAYAVDYDRQEIRLERQKCANCRGAVKQARAEADAALIANLMVADLEGSPKQIAWAVTIRTARLARLQRAGSDGISQLSSVSDAKWWIDTRNTDDVILLAQHQITGAHAGMETWSNTEEPYNSPIIKP